MRATEASVHVTDTPKHLSAADAGEFLIGGDLHIHRLGFGAMRITGKGIWQEPQDRNEAIRVLRRAIELGVNFIVPAGRRRPRSRTVQNHNVSGRLGMALMALTRHPPNSRDLARSAP